MMMILAFALMIDGSMFANGSFEEIKTKASQDNKLIMVDVYTTWCGPCKLMDRTTFRDKKVKDLLASKFISMKIDAEKGEGVAIAKKYKVAGYPCMLILDKQGNLVAKQLGYMPPKNFIDWLKNNI